jgi:tetratricopeptide (TPR) repeat protein
MTPQKSRSLVCSIVLLFSLLGASIAQSATVTDGILSQLFSQYQTESIKVSPDRRNEFFQFWEGQFKNALNSASNNDPFRITVLHEVGNLQKALERPDDALNTFRTMVDAAKESDDVQSQIWGLDNSFELLSARFDPMTSDIGEQYVAAAASRVGQNESPDSIRSFSNAQVSVAIYLFKSVSNPKFSGDRVSVLRRSIELFKAALTLKEEGATPTATKMYWLASAYASAGDKKLAAATYRQIAEMKQDVLSPLWMKQLQIEQEYPPGTSKYCAAFEEALSDFERSGKVDEHEVTFRHLLGKSYRQSGMLEKSSAVLVSLVGKSGDQNMDAYNLLLAAENELELGHLDAARDLFTQITTKYPSSGSVKLAEAGLVRIANARELQEISLRRTDSANPRASSRFGLMLLIANIAIVLVLASVSIYRQVRARVKSS